MNWALTYKIACITMALLVCLCIGWIFYPKCRELWNLQDTKELLKTGNRETEASINELKAKQDRFKTDPAFVEKTAREEANMVRPDEIVFRVTNSLLATGGLSSGNKGGRQ